MISDILYLYEKCYKTLKDTASVLLRANKIPADILVNKE